MWWTPQDYASRLPALDRRMAMIRAMRRWFDSRDFREVETPALQACPVIDAHILALATDLRQVGGAQDRRVWLHTSPEFAMKKLLVAGLPRLYQICRVYRDAEGSRMHRREFTMLEWYRAQADYTHMMDDCMDIVRACSADGILSHKGMTCDPHVPWEKLSVCEAFARYADIDLFACLDDSQSLRTWLSRNGIHFAEDDGWDDLFFRVMAGKIEPFLGKDRPTILYDYPVCMASLARRKPEDPRFAERFEVYACGIELANAFSELTDGAEQRARFTAEFERRADLYGDMYPLDEEFLCAVEWGLPESGGCALGVDRLAMLVTGVENIDGVLWTPAF